MSVHLHRDLERLQRRIVSLAGAVEQAVDRAILAIFDRDAELALTLMHGDTEIDMEETRIEEDCLKILALHQPVAVDLRRVVMILKINSDLERMGDLAANIAERAHALALGTMTPIPQTFRLMTDLTNSMVRESLDSFINLDVEQAKRVCRLDDEVDRYNVEIIETVRAYMKKSVDNVEPGMHLFSAARQLERVADHATNIAEDVVYLVEGRIIRHRPEEIRKSPEARP